jgi:hypothetical protein
MVRRTDGERVGDGLEHERARDRGAAILADAVSHAVEAPLVVAEQGVLVRAVGPGARRSSRSRPGEGHAFKVARPGILTSLGEFS